MLIIALTLTLPLKTIHIYILMPRTVNVGANRNAGGSVQVVQFDKPTYRMLWNLYGIIVLSLWNYCTGIEIERSHENRITRFKILIDHFVS